MEGRESGVPVLGQGQAETMLRPPRLWGLRHHLFFPEHDFVPFSVIPHANIIVVMLSAHKDPPGVDTERAIRGS